MALYHSAKGSVNYTIVGNPTIVDGVVSGFSSSDYLTSSQNVPTSSVSAYEFSSKFTTGSSHKSNNTLIAYTTNYGGIYSGIRLIRTGKIEWFVGRVTDSQTSQLSLDSNVTLQLNTTYWFKAYTKNNIAYLDLSTDGKSYTTVASASILSGIEVYTGYKFGIGENPSWAYYSFNGSIDLNETYIKVNGQPWFGVCPVEVQKHRLKGPVGYEVVGSPTIVDGIVSGFSTSDYLQTTDILDGSKDVDMTIKCTTGSGSLAGKQLITGTVELYTHAANNNLRVSVYDTKSSSWKDENLFYLSAETTYYIKIVKNAFGCVISSSTDNVSYVTRYTADIDFGTTSKITFGRSSSRYWSGSIDLNQTYIKVNGKLWFYQPADTKYIVKDGKLVWADPRIYLDNSGTTTRNYFSLQTLPENDTYKVYMRVRPSSIKNNGIFTANSTNRFAFVLGYTGPVYARIFGSSNTAAGVNYVANDLIEMTASKEGFFGNVAETSFNVAPAVTPTFSSPGTSADVLSAGTGSTFPNDFLGKFYGIKIWSNGVLREDVVPVPAGLKIGSFTVPSNGLFDIVKQQFYPNQGSETLLIGRDE